MLTAEPLEVALFGSMSRFGDLAIHAVVDLRRAFSRAELERAVLATIADFPVLGLRYQPGFLRDRWVPVSRPIDDAVHVVDAPPDIEAEAVAWSRRPLDPTRDRPFRLVSMPRDGGSRLVISMLHLAVDGAGFAAVAHVLGAHLYGVPTRAPIERGRRVTRALTGLQLRHLPVLARDIVKTALQPLSMIRAARREQPYPQAASPAPSFRHLVVTAAELAALRGQLGDTRASVNDLLVAALACVAAKRSSSGHVAVTYTMDLRRYARAPALLAANASTLLTAFVPREATAHLATTVTAVQRITRAHRNGLFGPAFLLPPLALTAALPAGVVRRILPAFHPLFVELPLSRGLLVTNVGRIDDGLGALGADVESVRIIGPNIEGSPIPAVVALGFRGDLHIELFAPPSLAKEALDELERELREALTLDAPAV